MFALLAISGCGDGKTGGARRPDPQPRYLVWRKRLEGLAYSAGCPFVLSLWAGLGPGSEWRKGHAMAGLVQPPVNHTVSGSTENMILVSSIILFLLDEYPCVGTEIINLIQTFTCQRLKNYKINANI